MKTDTALILGIPVDNLSFDGAVDAILDMTREFQIDQRARYVATVNVDFIVNTVSWWPGRFRHPELVSILRKADLVTADGMPVVWAARLLGTPLKERVTGADLVPALAGACARHNKSIYLLGGSGDVAQKTADLLTRRFPGLHVAGVSSPFVHVEGRKLENEMEMDQKILEEINLCRPDILLIAFGNPKQEMWFERNRSKLKAAVTIGIGGTFEFITGRVKRAPEWVQKSGLEWIFRLTQDPVRLFKRYFIGFFKFGTLILPPILYTRYRQICFRLSAKTGRKNALFTNECHEEIPEHPSAVPIQSICFDDPLDAAAVAGMADGIMDRGTASNALILDLSRVSFMDSSGLGLLVRFYQRARNQQTHLALCGVCPTVLRTLKVTRILDLMKTDIFDTREQAAQHLAGRADDRQFTYFKDEGEHGVILHLFGQLDADKISRLDLDAFLAEVTGRDTILNLQGLAFADSSAIMLILKLRKQTVADGKQFILCEPRDNVRQMLKITRVDKVLTLEKTLMAAMEKIQSA